MTEPRMDVFFDVQSDLPRQGPGDDASTRRALTSCTALAAAPRVLDVGCGPGAQTLALAALLPDARITAIDIHQPYLDELDERARAAGVSDRVDTRNMSMTAIRFPPASFDLIWAEGSAYIMGIARAVAAWRSLIARGGWLAFTELVWLVDDRPTEAVEFFAEEYPAMADRAHTAGIVRDSGYELAEQFTLPDASWWVGYYTPLLARLPALESKYAGDAAALSIVASSRHEVEIRRRYGSSYGYEFYIARKLD